MKIATWNVNGIRAREKQFCEWMAGERPDVVCLQELKAEPAQVPGACRLVDYHAFWHGMRAYSGVSLHIRKEAFGEEPRFEHPDFDMESRIVQAAMGDLVIASVYVPNGNKNYAAKVEFMKRLAAWARDVHGAGRKLVLCGDINITRTDMDVHPSERRPGIIGQRPEERDLFAALLGEHLVDVGRALDPANDRYFTWWAPWRSMRQRNIGWRLDYILASPSIAERAVSCPVLADVGTSDHAPVMMTTGSQGPWRGFDARTEYLYKGTQVPIQQFHPRPGRPRDVLPLRCSPLKDAPWTGAGNGARRSRSLSRDGMQPWRATRKPWRWWRAVDPRRARRWCAMPIARAPRWTPSGARWRASRSNSTPERGTSMRIAERGRVAKWTREQIDRLSTPELRALLENAQRLQESEVAALCSELLSARPRGHAPKKRAAKAPK